MMLGVGGVTVPVLSISYLKIKYFTMYGSIVISVLNMELRKQKSCLTTTASLMAGNKPLNHQNRFSLCCESHKNVV